jgi:DNA repair exonuclease SbcCD ATPase subunit
VRPRRRAGCLVLVFLVLAFLVPAYARAADVGSLERAVRDAYADRARLVEERAQRMTEASRLADEIARRKRGSRPNARADKSLEEALKRFDRLATALDDFDRRIIGDERSIIALRRRFEEAANAEAARLAARAAAGRIGEVARALAALDESRRRVALLAVEPAFRPVLDVTLAPTDGSIEVEHKLLLLESERERAHTAVERLDAEASVLSERIALKRQISAQLEAAVRAAGSDLTLLRRESEAVGEALRDLSAQRGVIERQRSELVQALATLDGRMADFRARLRELGAPKGDAR